jgi:xanthine dehydrogenase accessory factor
MLELATQLLALSTAGERVAVVTVTRVARSAPRGLGASMAITSGGGVIGSISGGCVEGDAIVLANAVLADGIARAARFGFSDERAHAAGLACGGEVDVLAYVLQPEDEIARRALARAARDERVTVAIGLREENRGIIADASVLSRLASPVAAELDAAAVLSETERIADGSWLALSRAPRARLIIVGAGEHAAALCRVASAAGFAVTVCDPWPLLATFERFPDASDIVIAEPAEYLAALASEPGSIDGRTAVCVLSHDERIDIPALHTALGMNVGFVGAMGARSTVAQRAVALRERGVPDADLARLHSPLGLDLGGSTPEDAAVAAVAEIIASRYAGTGAPLREATGPIHARTPADSPSSDIPSGAPACSPL